AGHSVRGFVLRPSCSILYLTWERVSPSALPIWLAENRWQASFVIFSTRAAFRHFFGRFLVLRPRRCIFPRTWPRVSPERLGDLGCRHSLIRQPRHLPDVRSRPLLISPRARSHFGLLSSCARTPYLIRDSAGKFSAVEKLHRSSETRSGLGCSPFKRGDAGSNPAGRAIPPSSNGRMSHFECEDRGSSP